MLSKGKSFRVFDAFISVLLQSRRDDDERWVGKTTKTASRADENRIWRAFFFCILSNEWQCAGFFLTLEHSSNLNIRIYDVIVANYTSERQSDGDEILHNLSLAACLVGLEIDINFIFNIRSYNFIIPSLRVLAVKKLEKWTSKSEIARNWIIC